MPKYDLNKAGHEESEFPSVCNTCLGPSPYVRMSKQSFGAECKICTRPFTVFRWQAGAGMRFKKTEVCMTCARLKNVCQTCLLDLQFGLPVQVRDTALGRISDAPSSNINREYYAQNQEASHDPSSSSSSSRGVGAIDYSTQPGTAQDLLKKLARTDPDYKRNRPHLCSFYARGECNRGDGCPYRHELPTGGEEMAKQNIKDRYYGTNDPVAKKILSTHASTQGLSPPLDVTITSLYLTSLPPSLLSPTTGQTLLRSLILPLLPSSPSSSSDPIRSITISPTTKSAFVNFVSRQVAELAALGAAAKGGRLVLQDGEGEVKVAWGRGRKKPSVGAAGKKGGEGVGAEKEKEKEKEVAV